MRSTSVIFLYLVLKPLHIYRKWSPIDLMQWGACNQVFLYAQDTSIFRKWLQWER